MTRQLIAALLLNFGAMAGAALAQIPRYFQSRVTRNVGWILMLGGAIGGLLAIYLFIQVRGWGYGLLLWFGSAGLSFLGPVH